MFIYIPIEEYNYTMKAITDELTADENGSRGMNPRTFSPDTSDKTHKNPSVKDSSLIEITFFQALCCSLFL
jgi:hypothetical protein